MNKSEAHECIACNADLIRCMVRAPYRRTAEAISSAEGMPVERVERALAWGVKRGVVRRDDDGGWSRIERPLAFENPFAREAL